MNNNVSNANNFEMATKFVTPEVTNMIHVATGVEHYTSVYNLVDMKEFGNIFKVNTVGQALTADEAFQQISQRAEAGIQHLFVWFTQEDYNKYVNNGNMTMIPGDNMRPKWSHWICTTTVHDCLTTAVYQLSQLHTTTSNMAMINMVVFELDPVNAGHATRHGICSWFNRSGCLTQLQIEKEYRLSNKELMNQHHFSLHGQVAEIFNRYSWEKGFGWTYNVVVNIDEAISEESPTHWAHYAMRQIMEYGGTQLMVQVNQTLAYKLLHYVEKFNISVEPNTNLTTDCIRGSTTFSGRFVDRMIQQVITETNELNQQEAMEVEAPTNVELGNVDFRVAMF